MIPLYTMPSTFMGHHAYLNTYTHQSNRANKPFLSLSFPLHFSLPVPLAQFFIEIVIHYYAAPALATSLTLSWFLLSHLLLFFLPLSQYFPTTGYHYPESKLTFCILIYKRKHKIFSIHWKISHPHHGGSSFPPMPGFLISGHVFSSLGITGLLIFPCLLANLASLFCVCGWIVEGHRPWQRWIFSWRRRCAWPKSRGKIIIYLQRNRLAFLCWWRLGESLTRGWELPSVWCQRDAPSMAQKSFPVENSKQDLVMCFIEDSKWE